MRLDNRLPGRVEFVSYLGAVLELHVRLSPADRVVVQMPNRGDAAPPEVGDAVEVGWPREAGLVFAGQGSPAIERENQKCRSMTGASAGARR